MPWPLPQTFPAERRILKRLKQQKQLLFLETEVGKDDIMTYLTVDTLEGGGPLAPGLGVRRVGGEVDGEGLHPREDGVHLVPDFDPPLRGLQVSLTLRCR